MGFRRLVRHAAPVIALVATFSLASCMSEEERRFWSSPQGQALQAQQAMQFSNQMHQRNMQYEQQSHELYMSQQPVRVQHSGTINHKHSGSLNLYNYNYGGR